MLNYIKQKLDSGTIELLRHGKNYTSASVLIKGLSVLSIPIMTRLLTPADYGTLAVFGSLFAIFSIFYGLGLRGAVSRYYYEKTDDFGTFFSTNALLLWSFGIIISILLYFFSDAIAKSTNVPETLISLALLGAFFSASYEYVSSYFQASKQSLLLSRLSIVRAVLSLIMTVVVTLMLNENKYLGSIYATMVFSVIFFFFSIYIVQKVGKWNFDLKYIKYALIFGLPVTIHLLSGLILNTFDQIMINSMVGSNETGLYSFAYKVGMLFQMVIFAMNQSWVPLFYEKMRDKEYESIKITAKKYAYLVGFLALFVTISGPVLVKVLAPIEYTKALPLVPIIISGFIFQYFYLMYINYAFFEKKTSSIATITLLAGILNIGLNYLAIPLYGYAAAAWTTLLTYMVFFVLHYINIRLHIKNLIYIPLKIIVTPGLFAMLLIGASTLVSYIVEDIIYAVLLQIAILIFYFILMIRSIHNA